MATKVHLRTETGTACGREVPVYWRILNTALPERFARVPGDRQCKCCLKLSRKGL